MSHFPQRRAWAAWLVIFLAVGGASAVEPATGKPQGKPNRLAKESSPYLLQHAHNPVDWHPWGEEALAKAKKEGKLIFLSVGYSSCHWCHVMERESFHDPEIARLLNEQFVCIKVDREERPDLDAIYMAALQTYNRLSSGRPGGGWPMSLFLTPETEPFFGGSYFPARDGDREGATGFLSIVKKVHEIWKASPERIREDAKTLTGIVRRELEGAALDLAAAGAEYQPEQTYAAALKALEEQFDPEYGGFGYDPIQWSRPKFPEPANLVYLLHRCRPKDAAAARDSATKLLTLTLDRMARGGIRDHLAGGFHRYSVDRMWRIPHFEKMLYDNAQLAVVYAEASVLLQQPGYAQIAREICDFVLAEMTDDAGCFYTALDADSEGEEGKFYRWSKAEVEKLLPAEKFPLFASAYGLTKDPNFEEHFYVLQLAGSWENLAEKTKLPVAELQSQLAPLRQTLLAARGKRERPLTDVKILTADNGLMIGALADCGRLLKEPRYLEAAKKAAAGLLTRMKTPQGRLLRTYAGGEAKLNAYLADYAYLAEGLLALHQATGDARWLKEASGLTETQIDLFGDSRGGFFFTSRDHEALFARTREFIDGASPSPNSVSVKNLALLAKLEKQPHYRELAAKAHRAAYPLLLQAPAIAPRMALFPAAWPE